MDPMKLKCLWFSDPILPVGLQFPESIKRKTQDSDPFRDRVHRKPRFCVRL